MLYMQMEDQYLEKGGNWKIKWKKYERKKNVNFANVQFQKKDRKIKNTIFVGWWMRTEAGLWDC